MKRIAAVLLLASLGGCSLTASPHREALVRFGRSGQAVRPYLVQPAPDASVQALYDSFDAACAEAVKAGE